MKEMTLHSAVEREMYLASVVLRAIHVYILNAQTNGQAA
jgi:hypothetical protein